MNPLSAQAFTIAQGLSITSMEPEELDILGSMPGNYCLLFLDIMLQAQICLV